MSRPGVRLQPGHSSCFWACLVIALTAWAAADVGAQERRFQVGLAGSHATNNEASADNRQSGFGGSLTRIDPTTYGNDPANWQAAAPTPGFVN